MGLAPQKDGIVVVLAIGALFVFLFLASFASVIAWIIRWLIS